MTEPIVKPWGGPVVEIIEDANPIPEHCLPSNALLRSENVELQDEVARLRAEVDERHRLYAESVADEVTLSEEVARLRSCITSMVQRATYSDLATRSTLASKLDWIAAAGRAALSQDWNAIPE